MVFVFLLYLSFIFSFKYSWSSISRFAKWERARYISAREKLKRSKYRLFSKYAFFLEPGDSSLDTTRRIIMELVLYLKGSFLALLLKNSLSFSSWYIFNIAAYHRFFLELLSSG